MNYSGGSIFYSIPLSPLLREAWKARYGLASLPGILNSILRDYPDPTILKGVVLLSKLHRLRLVGAQLDVIYLLYELTY